MDTQAPSAIVAIATTDKGVLLPRLTTVQRNDSIKNLVEGLTIFNTDSKCYQVYIGVGQPQADASGWDDYCEQDRFSSLKIGPGTLEKTALLQVSSNNKGVLLPRMTSLQRNKIQGTVEGLMIFNTDTHCHEAYRKSGQWYSYCTQKPIPPKPPEKPDIPRPFKPPGSSRANPFEGGGCSRLQQSYSSMSAGEYWFRLSPDARPIKLFCAMIEDKAYTLIWSYSEKTAMERYPEVNTFVQYHPTALMENYPRNLVRAFDGKITYEDFRLDHQAMLKLNKENLFFVRTVDDPRSQTRVSEGTYTITDLSALNTDPDSNCNFIEGDETRCDKRLQQNDNVRIRGCLEGGKITQL